MKNYLIINGDTIQKRIEELDLIITDGKPTGEMFIEVIILKKVLLQATPLNIGPLQDLVNEGYDPYDSAHHLQVQRMLKVIQDYISNLKLDI